MSKRRERHNDLLPLKGNFAEMSRACDRALKARGAELRKGMGIRSWVDGLTRKDGTR